MIDVFTDGSAKGKPWNRRGGYGIFCPDNNTYNTSGKFTDNITNQRTELKAILVALELTKEEKSIRIITDSMYAYNSFTKWYKNWIKNNEEKANWDMVRPIIDIILDANKSGRHIEFLHVNSHLKAPADQGSKEYYLWYGNMMADKYANFGCDLSEPDSIIKPFTNLKLN